MKIDLRKDRGILGAVKFSSSKLVDQDLTEDELIAETLRRRHTGVQSEDGTELDTPELATEATTGKKSTARPFRFTFLMIILFAVTAYYFHSRDLLLPSADVVKTYWMNVMGIPLEEEPSIPVFMVDDSLMDEGILTEDIFNQLMPVTEDIAALADSLAALPSESLIVPQMQLIDDGEDSSEYLPIAQEAIQLSDDDIMIIDNRSLMLMLTEIIASYPFEIGDGHVFLKRDALNITAPQGGEWVKQIRAALDKFVMGSFDEKPSPGTVKLVSKFSIIMNAEQDLHVQVLDEMKLLDVLANPFNDYLREIIVDLSRGIDDNPAKFTFTGSPQEMQYVLSYWAETRTNIVLRSADIQIENKKLVLILDVIFFKYKS